MMSIGRIGKVSKTKGRHGRDRAAGFSLIELLVVMAIIALLIGLGGPSLVGVFRSSSLGQGGQMIQDELNSYRQAALARNCPVEVRFYKYIDPSLSNDPGYYRAIQGFALTAPVVTGGTITYTKTPLSKAFSVPESVIIDSGASLSQFFTACSSGGGNNSPGVQSAPVSADPSLLNVGLNYSYAYFQFRPDGSTNFTVGGNGPWIYYLTVHPRSSGDKSTVAKNKNYYTIQLDPINGRLYSYRP